MNSRKLLLTLIGGWIVLMGLEGTNNKMGSLGARSLTPPLKLAFLITKAMKTVVLFLLAASTFLLMARLDDKKRT